MHTNQATPSARRTSSEKTGSDAIKLLIDDHNKVKKMFKEFEKIGKNNAEKEKEALATQICKELTVHAQLEEEIFYPAVREGIDDDALMNEAMVEHAEAKDLIAQIQSMAASDSMYDAKVTVLSENIIHHVEEEETEMFPKAKKSDMDLEKLGLEMAKRKEALMED